MSVSHAKLPIASHVFPSELTTTDLFAIASHFALVFMKIANVWITATPFSAREFINAVVAGAACGRPYPIDRFYFGVFKASENVKNMKEIPTNIKKHQKSLIAPPFHCDSHSYADKRFS